jgi:hypothetical protein
MVKLISDSAFSRGERRKNISVIKVVILPIQIQLLDKENPKNLKIKRK